MRRFGLIGYPLGHSFSKKYFTEKFQTEHIIDCSYELYPLKDIDELPKLISENPDLSGFNITIPYKSAVIDLLDKISPEAEEIGAVNVVKIKRRAGKIEFSGFNSDAAGFSDSLFPHLGKNAKRAIVLGTGGSSKAVCYVLRKAGMDLTIVSRNPKPGTITYSEIDPDLIADTDLIVNTTPLGMFPDIDRKPELDYNLLGKKHILFDLVYNPELTSFLKMGQKHGCKTISGIRMLYLQAEKSWEIWNDENIQL